MNRGFSCVCFKRISHGVQLIRICQSQCTRCRHRELASASLKAILSSQHQSACIFLFVSFLTFDILGFFSMAVVRLHGLSRSINPTLSQPLDLARTRSRNCLWLSATRQWTRNAILWRRRKSFTVTWFSITWPLPMYIEQYLFSLLSRTRNHGESSWLYSSHS